MEEYKQVFLKQSADIGALFFKDKLFLKDGRPTPYFYNKVHLQKKQVIDGTLQRHMLA